MCMVQDHHEAVVNGQRKRQAKQVIYTMSNLHLTSNYPSQGILCWQSQIPHPSIQTSIQLRLHVLI